MTRNISTMPLERILPLQAGHRKDTTSYRVVMAALILSFGFCTYRVARIRARHPNGRGAGPLLLAAIPLILFIAMGVLPFRLMFENTFDRVDYAGERCYLLGQSASESLIHCPDSSPPRNRKIARDDPAAQRPGISESIFSRPLMHPEKETTP